MTDHSPAGVDGSPTRSTATEARLAALRDRRSRSGHDTGPKPPSGRSRRRHAAAGGRILAAGLSASAALGLMAAMAGGSEPAPDVGVAPAASQQPVVVVGSPDGDAIASSVAAPSPAPTTATPVTASHAS